MEGKNQNTEIDMNDIEVLKAALAAEKAKNEEIAKKNAEFEEKEAERQRIADYKKIIVGHSYGEKATELLIMRNMTPEIQDVLAPPEVLVNFLKIYDLKTDDGNSRICVSAKELKKCQEYLDAGNTLASLTLPVIDDKKAVKNSTHDTINADNEEVRGPDNADVAAKEGTTSETNEPDNPEAVEKEES